MTTMTDNEIIETLKNCIYQWGCSQCKFYDNHDCRGDVVQSVLDLINRQKAEIERLERHTKMHDEIKAEAVKEAIDNQFGGCKGCTNIGLRYPLASMYPCNNCVRADMKDYYGVKVE